MADARLVGFGRAYTTVAIHALNVIVLFVAINMACLAAFALRPPPATYNPASFPREKLHAAYGDMSMDIVLGTLDENWNKLRFRAAPWVHVTEAEFHGRYVDVSADSVRSNGGPPAPLPEAGDVFRVFVFGGSTTFGYGLPDGETIPAYLERALRARHPRRAIEVKNHGHCFYWSAQELALLESLLRRGEQPSAVVFVDGLNEATVPYTEGDEPRFDEPARFADARLMFERFNAPPDLVPQRLPLVRMIQRVRDRAARARSATAEAPHDATWVARGVDDAAKMFRMYLNSHDNAADAARHVGAAAYFFWQPVPNYAYDARKLIFAYPYDPRFEAAITALYARMDADKPLGIVNLSHLLEAYDKPAYVDLHHYAPEVARLLAERMADTIAVPD